MEKELEEEIICIPLSHFGGCVGIHVKKSQEENEVDNERTIIQRRDDAHIVRLATVQMEKADR